VAKPPREFAIEHYPGWLFDAQQNEGIRSKQSSPDRIGQRNDQEAGHHHRQSVGNLSYASLHVVLLYKPLWLSSQNGGDLVRLQVQNCIGRLRVAFHSSGSKPVTSWEPSQNGWLLERPQRHHQ
jgi:hypothetical protein